MTSKFRTLTLCTLIFAGISTSGCLLKALGVRTNVNMEKWEVEEMKVALRDGKARICPGESSQVFVEFQAHKKGDPTKIKTLHTQKGNMAARSLGTVSFDEFDFESTQGHFNKEGYFVASSDVLSSLEGFRFATTYRRNPSKHNKKSYFATHYECSKEVGLSGKQGRAGAQGAVGTNGANGGAGSNRRNGGPGYSGDQGRTGYTGGAGQKVVAYATRIKTKLHEDLVAVRIVGEKPKTAIFHLERGFVVSADGGDGGSGGRGGTGGRGGKGAPGYSGGSGGGGGPGGTGGNGGSGGTVDLVIDERYPELQKYIKVQARGGRGGSGGRGGDGGLGGDGGSAPSDGGSAGSTGSGGESGPGGITGNPGAPGTAEMRLGDVSEHFADFQGRSDLVWVGPGDAADKQLAAQPEPEDDSKPSR